VIISGEFPVIDDTAKRLLGNLNASHSIERNAVGKAEFTVPNLSIFYSKVSAVFAES
jgi:hypothetical protein